MNEQNEIRGDFWEEMALEAERIDAFENAPEEDPLTGEELDAWEAGYRACPECGYANAPCGALGAYRHYTCRGCGLWFYTFLTPNHEEEE